MNLIKFSILVLASLCGGCALVPCNHVFPKLEWYWSQEAINCRKMQKSEKEYQNFREKAHTGSEYDNIIEVSNPNPVPNNYDGTNLVSFELVNETPAPENKLVLMLGSNDIAHDQVSTNSTGEITRVHDGWIYRFYHNGGIDSITQQPQTSDNSQPPKL